MLYVDLMKTFESSRESLIASAKGLDSDVLMRRPDDDTWSILDVFDHIQRVEAAICRLLEALTSRARKRDNLPAADMVDVPVDAPLIDSDLKFDFVPAFAGTEPDRDRTWDEVNELLIGSRETLRGLASVGRDHDCSAIIAPHPATRRLNFYEWFHLVAEHDRLHTEQVLGLL